MKIERINENSICCTLTSFDLSVRNLNIRELAYGTEKARKLFDEMMHKASAEVGFNADGTPIMIEAVPMSSDSIKLIISKVTDPEELDARFSRFTRDPAGRREAESWLNKLASALLEGAESLMSSSEKPGSEDIIEDKPQSEKSPSADQSAKKKPGTAAAQQPGPSVPEYRAFAFADLDQVIAAARAAGAYQGMSRLFKSHLDGSFVLVVNAPQPKDDSFARCCNSIAEYGRMIRTAQNTIAYYEEHYRLIVPEDAIGKLSAL